MQRYFSHICDGTDLQAYWRRSCTYGRAPNAIDISQGSLTRPAFTDTGPPFLLRWFGHTALFSRLLRHAGYTEDVFSHTPPPRRPHGGAIEETEQVKNYSLQYKKPNNQSNVKNYSLHIKLFKLIHLVKS